jgi:S-adenosylmethionine hydrolase
VDPGVGTARKACVAKTKRGHLIVTPDNKTLTHIAKFIGLEEVREIPSQLRFASPYKTAVFHGRDVFGYVGALLASGQIKFEELGEPYQDYQAYILEEPRVEENKLIGIVEILDPNFGNAWTNIPISWAEHLDLEFDDQVEVDIYDKERLALQLIVPYKSTFGGVHENEAVLYANELECFALAINQGSFINTYRINQGPDWCICIRKVSYA